MKKSEIKRVLKPLIKECIKEVLFEEEGVLSNVISEVVRGVQVPVIETKKNSKPTQDLLELERKQEQARQERIKRLNESVGGEFFNNTKPTPAPQSNSQGPLAGVAPGDKGVNIDGLFATVGKKWKALS
tara:strand:- start:436 stop:822 length:387 start_codon:yes stop_codon:yes gene_type:complete